MIRYRRRGFRRGFRQRKNYIWVRGAVSQVTGVSQPNFISHDLLAGYRSSAGITLNIPEFTVWRIHIKISIQFGLSPVAATANDGCLVASFVEQTDVATIKDPLAFPYNERYLIWEQLFAAEQRLMGTPSTTQPDALVLYKVFDVRSRRRLDNLNDTLWLTVTPNGNANSVTDDVKFSILLRQK